MPGFCCIELDDRPEAEANLERAIALHREIGQPISGLQGELGQGRLLIRRGETREAIDHLRRVRREVAKNGRKLSSSAQGAVVCAAPRPGART